MAGATLLGVILNDAPDVLPSALPARGSGARRRGSRGGALTDDTARDTDVPSPKRHDEAGKAHQAAPAADDDRPAEGDAPEARLAPAVLGGPTDGDDRI
jgi:hypothetical protein